VERAALLGRLRAPLNWRLVTVTGIVDETPTARTIVLDVPGWPGHRAGQHVDVRLTAEDGYQAQRSYSIGSAPELEALELTVERIDDGEVSPYLAGELRDGDQFELRGPVGGHFTWSVDDGGPLLLIGGGSGIVPLMSMLRHRAARASDVETHLLVSARSYEDLFYRDELGTFGDVNAHYTLTRGAPPEWSGFDRRVDAEMLRAVGPDPAARPRTFVCGPTGFVESVADQLVEIGHPPLSIHAERFGPTG
jgi:ferredoxin-NADP reductase